MRHLAVSVLAALLMSACQHVATTRDMSAEEIIVATANARCTIMGHQAGTTASTACVRRVSPGIIDEMIEENLRTLAESPAPSTSGPAVQQISIAPVSCSSQRVGGSTFTNCF